MNKHADQISKTKEENDVRDLEEVTDPERREALEKLIKYTPPAMITLLARDSAWAQISGGPPPPPGGD